MQEASPLISWRCSVCAALIGGWSISNLSATETWTEQDTPSNLDLYGITSARLEAPEGPRSSFFIAGQGGIWRGDQPLAGEWELVMSEPGVFRGIAAKAGGAFPSVEAVGDAGKVARSLDGTNWNIATISGAGNFRAVAANDNLVVAVDDGGRIFAGNSVVNLNERHTAAGVTWQGAAFGNGVWVVVGSGATVAISTNGSSWQVLPEALSDGLPAVDFHDVAFGPGFFQGGFFMAVGAEGFISISGNGRDWTERQSGRGAGRLLRASAFAARHAAWIAMGDGGLGNISHDGAATFSNLGQTFPQGMNDLAFGLGFTVAVGDGGKVFSSVTRLNPISSALGDAPAGQISVGDRGGNFTIQLNNTSSQARWRVEVIGTIRCPEATNFITVSPGLGTGLQPASFTIEVEPFGTIDNRCGVVLLNDIQIPIVQAGDGDPQPVTILTADPLTDRAIRLSWRTATGATHYEVHRRQDGQEEYVRIATVPGEENASGELEYTDRAGLLPNRSYCYQVIALNLVTESRPRFPGGVICLDGCDGPNRSTFLVEFGRARQPSPEACATTLLAGAGGFFGQVLGFEAIELHWNPVPGAASYLLERNGGTGFFTIAALAGTNISHLDTTIPNLDYFQSYTYRLTASGGVPQTTTVRTTVEPPAAFVVAVDLPDFLAIEGAFDLTWSRRDFLNTEVQTRVEPGGDWISLDRDNNLVSLISATNRLGMRAETWRYHQPAALRSFRVRARAHLGSPNPPSPWIVCGPVSTPPPSNPTAFTVSSRASTTASVQWEDGDHERSYQVTARPASAIDQSQDIVLLAPADSTSAILEGLFPGTAYDVFLVAVGVEGENASSRSTMGANSATLTFNALPRGPSRVSALARGSTFVTVSWPQVNRATGYEVWRREYISPVGWTQYALFTSTGSGSLSATDFSVEGGRRYQYQVRAEFGEDFTDFRESTAVGTPLGAPNLVSVTPVSASAIALDWTDANDAVLGYAVERSARADGPWSTVQTINNLFGAPPTVSTNRGLSADTTYFYRLRALALFNEESPPSNVRSATTLSRLTVADATSTSFTLTWDPQRDVKEYEFEQSTSGPEGPFRRAGAALPEIEKFSVLELSPSKIYYYRMRPLHKNGEFGPFTEVARAVTDPLPPANLKADFSSSPRPQVDLSWNWGSGWDFCIVEWRPGEGDFTSIGTNSDSRTFTHQGLHPGQNDYRVRVSFQQRLSAFSAVASVNWSVAAEEQWRFDHFGDTENNGEAADEADPDADGAPNRHERAAGTNPNDPADFLHFSGLDLDPSGLMIYWKGVEGITYDISESADLIDFHVIPSLRRISGGGEESASIPLSAPIKAYRLEVFSPEDEKPVPD